MEGQEQRLIVHELEAYLFHWNRHVALQRSDIPNVRFTFDGDKLVKVELIGDEGK
jgi:hypothetical protein